VGSCSTASQTSKPPAGGPDFFPSLWITQFFDYPNKNSSQTKPNNTFLEVQDQTNKEWVSLGTFQWAKFGRIGPPSSYPDHISIPKQKSSRLRGARANLARYWSQNAPPILCETYGNMVDG